MANYAPTIYNPFNPKEKADTKPDKSPAAVNHTKALRKFEAIMEKRRLDALSNDGWGDDE